MGYLDIVNGAEKLDRSDKAGSSPSPGNRTGVLLALVLALGWLLAGGAAAAQSTVSPPAGTFRNLVGSGTGTAKTASWSCDYLVAATAINGSYYANSAALTTATLAFNGANTGAGGMDTGATPTSSSLYVYAIYNPTTTTWSVLGTTTGAGATIYAGSNLPSGYTASCLIWSGVTSAGKVQEFCQQDRHISILRTNVLNISSSVPTTYTALSLSSCIPANAKTVDGLVGGPSEASDVGMCMASNSSGISETPFLFKIVDIDPDTPYLGDYFGTAPFSRFPLIISQTLYYQSVGSTNPVRIDLNGYTF